MRMPKQSFVKAMFFYLVFSGMVALLIRLLSPESHNANATQRVTLFLMDMVLPICIGAAASNVPWVVGWAGLSIVVYMLAVTTRAFRSKMLAILALTSYSYLTLFTLWVEPWILSVESAAVEAVKVFVLKISFGIFELIITAFWFFISYPVGWQLTKEFQDAEREEKNQVHAAGTNTRATRRETRVEVLSSESPDDYAPLPVTMIAFALMLGTIGVLVGLITSLFVSASIFSCIFTGALCGAVVGLFVGLYCHHLNNRVLESAALSKANRSARRNAKIAGPGTSVSGDSELD